MNPNQNAKTEHEHDWHESDVFALVQPDPYSDPVRRILDQCSRCGVLRPHGWTPMRGADANEGQTEVRPSSVPSRRSFPTCEGTR